VPFVETSDSVRLHYEETGSGNPIVFVHEFAGDGHSWAPQVGHFAARYRCITYNARGYPPSDVPDDPAQYSQAIARDDIKAVLDHLSIEQAHVVGLSMGGFATLHFALAYPARTRAAVVAGCGYGAEPDQRARFREEAEATAVLLETRGTAAFAATYAVSPTRVQFRDKDPNGWRAFADGLAAHSALGSAHTMRGVQKERPSLWDLEDDLKRLTVPTLIMTGDEDDPCLAPALYLKRAVRSSGLVVIPRSGHTINLEEPKAFNAAIADFLARVEADRWPVRGSPSVTETILGVCEAQIL